MPNGATAKAKDPSNVTFEVKDNVLAIGIDLSKRLGQSKSGRSTLIGTTHGIIKDKASGVSFSVTAFVPVPKGA